MSRRIHIALTWLLLLALPLQGFAAATMINCGPNHHRMSAATAVALAQGPASGLVAASGAVAASTLVPVLATARSHVHALAHAHAHATGDHMHAHALAARAPDAGSVDVGELAAPLLQDLDKLSKLKCSACAACCIGAALPTAAVATAPFPPAIVTATFVATPHADFVADGLDPPPRLFFA